MLLKTKLILKIRRHCMEKSKWTLAKDVGSRNQGKAPAFSKIILLCKQNSEERKFMMDGPRTLGTVGGKRF